MKQLPNNLLHEGYILIPKALLKRQINDKAPGELEALLQVLIHANYSETTYKIQQIDIVCQRGESVISQQHWSRLFQWSRSKTLRFFQKIQEEGIIKIIPHQKGIFHIHINNYDFWTGCISPEAREEKKKEKSEVFDVFWDKYHETMQNPNSTSPVPAANGTSSPKRNSRQPSTTSRKSTTTPTTHVSSPLPPPT